MAFTLTSGDKQKIKACIEDGMRVKTDIQALQEGMKDSVKDISKQLGIPAKVLNKAINFAFKDSYAANREELDDVEQILIEAGYGSNVPADMEEDED